MSVQLTRLASGVTVVSHQMNHLQSAALGIWVDSGSRSEAPEQHGIAHLLEHMAFKGTAERSALQIAEEIEAVGGELNASTSVEHTQYFARVLKDNVPLAMDILTDILRYSEFDPNELQREQHVIVQEIGAVLDTPEDLVFDYFSGAAFPNQAVGRPILGTPESVRAMTRQSLFDFLGVQYRGPALVVSAAGAVDHESLVQMADNVLGMVDPERGPAPELARYNGGEHREIRDLMEAQIVIGFGGRAITSPDYYTAQILAMALGGGMSSRLFQEVREKRGLCYSIYAFHWAFADGGVFGVHAAAGADDIAELTPVILGEFERAAQDLTQDEIDRAKAQARAGLLMALESPIARSGQLARQIMVFGRLVPIDELVEKIDAVIVDDAKSLAGSIFTETAPTVAAVGPVSTLIDYDRIVTRLGAPAAA